MKKLIALLLILLLTAGCAGPGRAGSSAGPGEGSDPILPSGTAPGPDEAGTDVGSDESATDAASPADDRAGGSVRVKQVEGLPQDFLLGMDASQVPALEKSGVKYYDFDGEEKDVFQILAENGVNIIRVRVWNDPRDPLGRGYGGGNCDAQTALEIGVRAARYGMGLLVDFHYSDFWADPGKQRAPKAWQDMDPETKAAALEAYTRDVLMTLRGAGVLVKMVQVGNETNGALCGETEWPAVTALMAAGSRAIRSVFPDAKVAVHFTNPESGAYCSYAEILKASELDYDVFGSSYYPCWHGSLENLTQVLARVREDYGKDVMVMETAYARTLEDSDFFGNTISENSPTLPYPCSLQGQADSLRDVTQAVLDAGGVGVCYWEGTWIGVGGASRAENERLWEAYGSGWASSFAGDYDPDAAMWHGGDAVDNQAFFDARGRALESLKAFSLIRGGQ